MGESDPVGSAVTAARDITNDNSSQCKRQEQAQSIRPGKFTLASYVDTIREGIKKISGYKDTAINSRPHKEPDQIRDPLEKAPATRTEGKRKARVGGIVIGVKRKNGVANHVNSETGSQAKRKTSFETFLSTLPKSDPVDRTVVWVYQQPVDHVEESSQMSFSSLPQRGSIVPIPQPPIPRMSTGGEDGYETSISCCESDRGTHGRGTPPPIGSGQPRLDNLFRQLHVRQERQARKRLAMQGERHLTSRNLRKVESAQVPGYPFGVTAELLPFFSNRGDYHKPEPPTIVHKNSYFYNHSLLPTAAGKPTFQSHSVGTYNCAWADCNCVLSTAQQLSEHVQDEHISFLPAHLSTYSTRGSKGQRLVCEWRGCTDRGGVFPARYKLLLHVQTCHCRDQVSARAKGESDAPSPDETHQPTTTFRRSIPHDYKNSTPIFTSKKPLIAKHPADRNSLSVTSYPLPEVGNKQVPDTRTTRESRRRYTDNSTGQQRTIVLHTLQPIRTQDLNKTK